MNGSHLHLLFTHLPIVGLGMAILINIYAIANKNKALYKLTLWGYVAIGIFSLLAYLTGDGAEEIIKTYPGITEDIIESHEQIALLFFIGMMAITAASLLGIYVTKTKESFLKKFNLLLLVAALLLSLLAIKTGATGGVIRHTEIEQGTYKK
jgi:uncharacterized membrane protein